MTRTIKLLAVLNGLLFAAVLGTGVMMPEAVGAAAEDCPTLCERELNAKCNPHEIYSCYHSVCQPSHTTSCSKANAYPL